MGERELANGMTDYALEKLALIKKGRLRAPFTTRQGRPLVRHHAV